MSDNIFGRSRGIGAASLATADAPATTVLIDHVTALEAEAIAADSADMRVSP
jgi:hypothetical protein